MAFLPDLFGYVTPKCARRVLAHAVDAGDHGCVYAAGMTMVALFRCARCNWESGWIECSTMTAVKRGIACEPFNKATASS